MNKAFLLLAFITICSLSFAQNKAYQVKGALANDVCSPDSIVSTLYTLISGEADSKKDWERFKSLWYPGANLTMVNPVKNGKAKQITMNLDEFIKLSGNHSKKNSFYEIEVNKKVDSIGHIAQVASTYVIKNDPGSDEIQLRGINLFQLYFDGDRWWILNCIWENEVMGMKISKDYLPKN